MSQLWVDVGVTAFVSWVLTQEKVALPIRTLATTFSPKVLGVLFGCYTCVGTWVAFIVCAGYEHPFRTTAIVAGLSTVLCSAYHLLRQILKGVTVYATTLEDRRHYERFKFDPNLIRRDYLGDSIDFGTEEHKN